LPFLFPIRNYFNIITLNIFLLTQHKIVFMVIIINNWHKYKFKFFIIRYSQLQIYLKKLETMNLPFLKRSFIGYSVEKKR